MREPVYKITNDDDPMDYEYPVASTLPELCDGIMYDDDYFACMWADVGQSVTVGGGASTQFTITRIR